MNPRWRTTREDSGKSYYRARYYNPALGRFISEDPIGFRGPDTNLYRYVWGSPATFADPTGKFGIGVTGGATAGAGLFAGGVATSSFGGGAFWGGGNGFNTGVFGSKGYMAGVGDSGIEYRPNQDGNWWEPDDVVVAGAAAGFGGGFFMTNAHNVCELKGEFDTAIIDVGPFEIQWAESGDVRYFSFTSGPSRGFMATIMQTSTTYWKPLSGRSCGCQ